MALVILFGIIFKELDSGLHSILIPILMSMVLCLVLGLVGVIEWRRRDEMGGWLGLGMMNTKKNVRL